MAQLPPALAAWSTRLRALDLTSPMRVAYQRVLEQQGVRVPVIQPMIAAKYMVSMQIHPAVLHNQEDVTTRTILDGIADAAAQLAWQGALDVTQLAVRVGNVTLEQNGNLTLSFDIVAANAPH
jgi:hypothetical protein